MNLLSNEKERMINALWNFSQGKVEFSHINYDVVEYIPVLAFGNPTYSTKHIDSGFGHIYVKTLDEAKLVFFDLPFLGEGL